MSKNLLPPPPRKPNMQYLDKKYGRYKRWAWLGLLFFTGFYVLSLLIFDMNDEKERRLATWGPIVFGAFACLSIIVLLRIGPSRRQEVNLITNGIEVHASVKGSFPLPKVYGIVTVGTEKFFYLKYVVDGKKYNPLLPGVIENESEIIRDENGNLVILIDPDKPKNFIVASKFMFL